MKSQFFVYVIKNEKNKTYIGQTSDLEKRLKRHNKILPVKKSSYTSVNHGVWKYVYIENYGTRVEALNREKYLKTGKGRDFLSRKIS